MTSRRLALVALGLALVAFAVAPRVSVRAQQTAAPATTVDADDLGGVVTGPKGPEAGVWVIAETADLPTKFAKIVVTDDQGRYLLPDLPKGNYNVWVRGYGLVDSPEGSDDARQEPQPDGNRRAERHRRRPLLSGRLLVLDDAGAGREGISGHRPRGERHLAEHQDARPSGSSAPRAAAAWPAISSAARASARFRKASDTSRSSDRRLGSARSVRPGGRRHERRPRSDGPDRAR